DVYLDSISGNMMVQLRGTNEKETIWDRSGYLIQYNNAKHEILWTKHIDFTKSYLFQIGPLLLLNKLNKSVCLNPSTGEQLWEQRVQISCVDSACQIGIGLRENTEWSQTTCVFALDLKKGKELWRWYVKHEYGSKDFEPLNDSTVMLVSAGLHTFNFRNGKGWSYGNSSSNTIDLYAPPIVVDSARFPGGIRNVVTTRSDYSGLRSDVVFDSLSMYFASLKYISKIQNNGQQIWKTAFPDEDHVSQSELFMDDHFIYMVNTGIGRFMNGAVPVGKPFLARFNKSDGAMDYLKLMSIHKDPLINYWLKDSVLYGLFPDGIRSYSLNNGNLIKELRYKEKDKEVFNRFANKRIYQRRDSVCQPLYQKDTTHLYVLRKSGEMFKLDLDLTAYTPVSTDSLFVPNLYGSNYIVLTKKGESLLVKRDGGIFGNLELSGNAIYFKDKIIDFYKNYCVEIELSALN
ncbi:MAG: hypothetical protein PHS30_09920, partial [Bacteroidales bacterium]|nr:hypothetical protein [Bacteroidales bacterium]